MHKYFDVARIVGTKGLDGRVTLYCVQGLLDKIESHPNSSLVFHFVPPKIDVCRYAPLSSLEIIDDRSALAFFDGIDNLSDAEALMGCHCLISAKDAKQIDFSEDINSLFTQVKESSLTFKEIGDEQFPVGWTISDSVLGYKGTVMSFSNPAGQILLEVLSDKACIEGDQNINKNNKSHVYIPLADDLIVDVDEQAKTINMSLPKGLLEL